MVMFNYVYVLIWLNGKNLGKMDKFLFWCGFCIINMVVIICICVMNKIMMLLKNEYFKSIKRGIKFRIIVFYLKQN